MMNARRESVLSLIAALLVLFSAMIAPPISAALAVLFLVIFGIYKYGQSRRALD